MTADNQSQSHSTDAPTGAQELTIVETAELLFVSEVHVRALLKNGQLAGAKMPVGGKVRISRDVVLALKARMRAEQQEGLAAMIEASQRIGLYDTEEEGLPTRPSK